MLCNKPTNYEILLTTFILSLTCYSVIGIGSIYSALYLYAWLGNCPYLPKSICPSLKQDLSLFKCLFKS